MTTPVPQCLNCKNFGPEPGWTCKAFVIIPPVIVINKHDHREPYPGDNGIRFEPIKTEEEPRS